MTKRYFFVITFFFAALSWVSAQDDPILFTVSNEPVHVSEFTYIYEKSNGDEADYSRASLDKYLDLYKNFKLKIARAKEMKLDTSPALIQELAGYRKKLANSYLIDKEVTAKLAKEAYERMKIDVRLSHIFFSLKNLKSPADTLPVYQKAMQVKKALDKGASFETLARESSEDKPSQSKGGDIGYFTAIFPAGFYQLEEAAYSTPIGKISKIVRSISGYHILKVTDKRPARGEMEIAQVLISNKPGMPSKETRKRAVQAQNALKEGLTFEQVAKKFSDDKITGAKGGYIGFVGINRFEREFEDAVFALTKDGQVSEIIQSSVGFHIIKRLRKKVIKPFEKEKRAILAKLRKDPRYQLAIDAFMTKTKKESGFKSVPTALTKWISTLPDSTFLTHKWRPAPKADKTVLFTIGDQQVTIGDLDDYAYKATRKRLRMGKGVKTQEAAKQLYEAFEKDKVMSFAEANLENKYPDFKSLMREYQEGILLFDISRREVWDKASEDSTGLANFYPSIQDQFQWEERAKVVNYTLPRLYESKLKKIRKYAVKKTPAKVLAKFNKETRVLTMNRETIEKSKASANILKVWRARGITETTFDTNRQPQIASFTVVEAIIPPGPKALEDAKGYAIAKYQDFLETRWIKSLQRQYKIKVDEAVLQSLVK